MKKYLLNALILATLSLVSYSQTDVSKRPSLPTFEIGQVWSYKTRVGEEKSTFIVLKIDKTPQYGNIIHIAVRDLKMKNVRSGDGYSNSIGHMPFAEKILAESAVKLLKERAQLPDFNEGYVLWRQAFDKQQAGFYTVTIAEAVKIAEETLNQ